MGLSMEMATKKTKGMGNKRIGLKSYSHTGAKRKNNPPVGLVSSATDQLDGATKHQHDPHIDPHLSWAGKIEGTEISVRNVSLHIHERIDTERIARGFLKRLDEKPEDKQMSLFQLPDNEPPLAKDINFYGHNKDWANRLIAGDSLLVMNSFLNKEGMAGKIQMIYIDPPYGIKYNSNFQPFTNKKEVKDNNDNDIPAEPETIKAFRDTWELGIHSYLSHLRDRLLLAKELLSTHGSCFVQISDENIHHVKEVMDEVLGRDNFIAIITFQTAANSNTQTIQRLFDHIVWYARDAEKVKIHKLFKERTEGDIEKAFTRQTTTGIRFRGESISDFTTEQVDRLRKEDRITEDGQYAMLFPSDFPAVEQHNVWTDTVFGHQKATEKVYVVQTNKKVIERCLLLCTDTGDLVFDPTCGGGTTAYVAEAWGRRWITCDTSRVALTLAKQRLMTAYFDYYELEHPDEGIASGLKYKRIPHRTMSSIANGRPPIEEVLYDKPAVVKDCVRVAGPFTVEAVPSVRVKPIEGRLPEIKVEGNNAARAGDTGNQAMWRDELKATGVRIVGGKKIEFTAISPMRGTKYLDAEGEILESGNINKKVVISFGPDFGPIEQRQIEEAIKEARSLAEKPDFVIFAAFHFDPEAAKDIDEIKWEGVQLLKVQMSVDLLTHDLRKKKRENQSYWLIGQPDVDVIKVGTSYKVKVNGFDYYNPISGEVESESSKKIAMWMLDTDYDGRSLLPEQVFFPQGDKKRDWTKLAKALNGEVDEEAIEKFTGTESLPFQSGQHRKIAVKIIDDRGIESLVIKSLE